MKSGSATVDLLCGIQVKGSYLVGVAQLANKKGIRHIINDGDDLADDGGHGQRGNGPADRHGIKQIFFTLGIIQDGFLFSASSTQSINRWIANSKLSSVEAG
jgi:hypothetical protein